MAASNTRVHDLSGQELDLLTKAEQRFYEKAQAKYVGENTFTQASDERSLDRLVLFETLMFRWQSQIASGLDYDQNPLNNAEQEQIRKNMKEYAVAISAMHNELGLSKAQRDKDQHESVGAYIMNLQARAKEFGVHREKQVDLSLTLIHELFAHVGAFQRSDEYERGRLGFKTEADIVKWIVDVMEPRFKQFDDDFINNQQKYWRSSL